MGWYTPNQVDTPQSGIPPMGWCVHPHWGVVLFFYRWIRVA